MGKLRVFSGRELCALLGAHGFAQVRQRGSHLIMQKRTTETTITVPVPDHAELKIGTVLSIIRHGFTTDALRGLIVVLTRRCAL